MTATGPTGAARELYFAGQLPQAEAACREALRRNSADAEALYVLGLIAGRTGHPAEALKLFQRAAAIRPDAGEIRAGLGSAYFAMDRLSESEAAYHEALRLAPANFHAWHNLAVIHQRRGRLVEAAEHFRRAIALMPGHALAHLNLGSILRDLGQMDESAAMLRQAIALNPSLADAHMGLAWTLLLQGRFAEAWPEYEWRARCPGFPFPRLDRPVWDGTRPAGRTILLHAEQGLGDSIQFVRYARIPADAGARVIVLCPRSLQPLLATAPGVAEVFCAPGRLPPFDEWIPMLSLPARLGTTAETIPGTVPYLHVDPVRARNWAERLANDPPGRKVGLCRAGNRANLNDENRSIPPELLKPLVAIPGVTFYDLRPHPGEPSLDLPLIDHTEHFRDFADTAALMTHLDLIITVDTAAAHLAGAIAQPVWTMLPFAPDWRWMLAREDTPWYPTMRLFRRQPCEGWVPVIEAVRTRLAEWLQRGGRP